MTSKFLATVSLGAAAASWFKSSSVVPAEAAPAPAFSQAEFLPYKLVDVKQESHNTKRFRFALADAKAELGFPVASCISLRYVDKDGKDVVRPYTPINLPTEKGHFDLVVKAYPNSKMGSHLFSLKKGDTIDVKGPWGTFPVAPSQYKAIGMLAGGTGITPMFQIINSVLSGPKNTTKITLTFSNHTAEDVLLHQDLTALADKHRDTFAVHHTLTKPPKGWTGHTGHIDRALIEATMPPPSEANIAVLVSGPPGFMTTISGAKDYSAYPPKQGELSGLLKDMGYTSAQVYKF